MAGNEGIQAEDAIEFIAFIERLTRNLLNDDQSQKETQQLWDALFDFMRPSDFGDAEWIKWAITAEQIQIVTMLQDCISPKKLVVLLNQIEPANLFRVDFCNQSEVLAIRTSVSNINLSMRYFYLTDKLTKKTPVLSEELLAAFERFTEGNGNILSRTPLMFASLYGLNKIINLLIVHGVDVNASDRFGATALHIASGIGNVETVKLLLNKGANINNIDRRGNTALMIACSGNHIEIVRLLLKKNSRTDVISSAGFTVLSIAKKKRHIEIIKLLSEYEIKKYPFYSGFKLY